jgi:hypothetical protein
MKKSVLTIVFLVGMIISYSQNYNPFLQNIGWCLETYSGLGYGLTAYTNNGDTTIGSLSYAKLYRGNTLFLVREDTVLRKAWVILPDSLSETLLYDFYISLGSQISLNYVGYDPVLYTVDSFDSINTLLGLRKRIKLSTTDTVFNPDLYWIEGIGSSYGPVYLYDPTYATGQTGGEGHCLICAYQEIGVQSYSGTCGLYCYPYPGSPCNSFIVGINEIKNDNPEITIEKVTTDLIRIQLNKNKIKEIKVFSVEGKLLKIVPNLYKNDYLLSTNDWTIGLYIIEVTSENGIKIAEKLSK